MRISRKLAHAVLLLPVLSLAALAFSVAPASASAAASPWWHLRVETLPSHFHAGAARDEVQELKVEATGGDVFWAVAGPEVFVHNAIFPFNGSAHEVQSALEGFYGVGNVEVTGGPVDTASGSVFGAATFMGNLTVGSPVVEVPEGGDLIGKFGVGQPVTGEHIHAGTTIVEANIGGDGGGTLKLSQNAEATAEGVELSGAASSTVEGFTPTSGSGSFEVGQEVTGSGIAPGTKLEAIDLATNTATLSQLPVYSEAPTVISSATAPYFIHYMGALGGRHVEPPTEFLFGFAGNFGLPGVPLKEGTVTLKEMTKGLPDGEMLITATNLGDANANGGTEPITLSDVLPAGLEAVGVSGKAFEGAPGEVGELECSLKGENGVSAPACSFAGEVRPYTSVSLHVAVDDRGASGHISQRASVSGAGARGVSVTKEVPLGQSTPYGLSDYELVNENEGGSPDTQAGSHPFQQTTTVVLNQTVNPERVEPSYPNGIVEPAGSPKDFHFFWPAGLIGNVASLPQCPVGVFLIDPSHCPAGSAVGVARTLYTFNSGGIKPEYSFGALYNLVPARGEPARLAFQTGGGPVYVDPSVRSGRDYGITLNVSNITQVVGVRSSEVTVWGVPGASSHDADRGIVCLQESIQGELCEQSHFENPPAFLSLPTACSGPLVSTVTGDSWVAPKPAEDQEQLAQYPMPALDGCDRLPFHPEISVTPDVQEASRPTGLNVDVHVPQAETLNPNGLAVADPKDITVTLPEGVAVNPSSGDGLQACSEGLVGFEGLAELAPGSEPGAKTATFKSFLPGSVAAQTAIEEHVVSGSEGQLEPGVNFCPDASKIGEVTIKTPVLPPTQPLKGAVYLAAQNQNPFGSLLAMYIVAEDPVSGLLARLAGQVHVNKEDGQLETTFENSPQAPFEDAELHFFGGERAPLVTPSRCGPYTTTATFTPWSGNEPLTASSTFDITSGPNGTPCPSGGVAPFHPDLQAGTRSNAAGSYSPLDLELTRNDAEQEITHFSLKLPPGLTGKLAGIPYCSAAAIAAAKARTGPEGAQEEEEHPSCPPASEIGHTKVGAGVGSLLVWVPGKLYLAGPYHGSAISVVAITDAKAGPFDLGTVVVREALKINPETAEVFVDATGSDPLPHIIQGIPTHLRKIQVYLDRPEFTLNPTSCEKTSIASTVLGAGLSFTSEADDQPVTVTSPFQAADCASLGFKPSLKLSLKGSTKRGGNPAFKAVLTPRPGDANTGRAQVTLPHSEFLDNAHIGTVCTRVQFAEGNVPGEKCPAASVYGKAKAITPILSEPLEGPVYLRSSSHQLPDLVAALHNNQVNIALDGHVEGVHGGIRNTFEAVPDAPVTKFTLEMQGGNKGLLQNSTNLCAHPHRAGAVFTGHNGKVESSKPLLAVSCGKHGKKHKQGKRHHSHRAAG